MRSASLRFYVLPRSCWGSGTLPPGQPLKRCGLSPKIMERAPFCLSPFYPSIWCQLCQVTAAVIAAITVVATVLLLLLLLRHSICSCQFTCSIIGIGSSMLVLLYLCSSSKALQLRPDPPIANNCGSHNQQWCALCAQWRK